MDPMGEVGITLFEESISLSRTSVLFAFLSFFSSSINKRVSKYFSPRRSNLISFS